MADGRDDRFNSLPNRGAKLRYEEGTYSDEMDYTEGGSTHLNQRTRMDSKNYRENTPNTDKVRDEGLNLKQPL
jgi:hypothetical protein